LDHFVVSFKICEYFGEAKYMIEIFFKNLKLYIKKFISVDNFMRL